MVSPARALTIIDDSKDFFRVLDKPPNTLENPRNSVLNIGSAPVNSAEHKNSFVESDMEFVFSCS